MKKRTLASLALALGLIGSCKSRSGNSNLQNTVTPEPNKLSSAAITLDLSSLCSAWNGTPPAFLTADDVDYVKYTFNTLMDYEDPRYGIQKTPKTLDGCKNALFNKFAGKPLNVSAEAQDKRFRPVFLLKLRAPVSLIMANAGISQTRWEEMVPNAVVSTFKDEWLGDSISSVINVLDISGNAISSLKNLNVDSKGVESDAGRLAPELAYLNVSKNRLATFPWEISDDHRYEFLDVSYNPDLELEDDFHRTKTLQLNVSGVKSLPRGGLSCQKMQVLIANDLNLEGDRTLLKPECASLVMISMRNVKSSGKIDFGGKTLAYLDLANSNINSSSLETVASSSLLEISGNQAMTTLPGWASQLAGLGMANTKISSPSLPADSYLFTNPGSCGTQNRCLTVVGGSLADAVNCKTFANGACQVKFGTLPAGQSLTVIRSSAGPISEIKTPVALDLPFINGNVLNAGDAATVNAPYPYSHIEYGKN